MGNNPFYFLILIILLIVFVVGLIILIKICFRLSEKNNMLRESIKDISDLNDKLRMERHDYLNHLQIIYGLM
ncbi:MAG: Spo0B domain-containing protein [Lachnospiraceae bacterium]|nr:Spo0B domain-containing protein [Lachnospiraceae bacterium]